MTNAELILQLVDKLLKQKEEIETLKSTKANTKDEKNKADNTYQYCQTGQNVVVYPVFI